jgi:hypothetical protein
MFWALYQVIVILSALASAGVWLVRPVRPVLGMAAAAGWTIATLQARNIEVFHQDGSSTVVGSEAWQLVALGLALLSLATVILWYLGVYPPVHEDDDVGAAAIPGDTAEHP